MKKLLLLSALLCVKCASLFSQICIPPSETCEDAPLYCGYYLNQVFTGFTGAPNTPLNTYGFCGTLENTQFLKFVPCSDQLTVVATPFNCTSGNGIQIALLENCQGAVIACDPGGPGMGNSPVTVSASVNPGKPYYLMIDGYSGDNCQYTLDIQGVDDVQPSLSGPVSDGSILFNTVPCGLATLTVKLPVCAATTSPGCQQSWSDYYTLNCAAIHWTLPPGVQIVSPDPGSTTITVQFTQTVTNGQVSADIVHTCQVCPQCIPGCPASIPPILISSPPSTFTSVPCSAAPLYCAASIDQENLSNSCTFAGFGWWQQGLWNADSCFSLENPNLYAIAACGDVLSLDIDVSNCANHRGLEFALMGGGACDFLYPLGSCASIAEGTSGQMSVPIFNNPDNVYYLVVDGIGLDACDFHVTASQLDSTGQPVTNCQYGADPVVQVLDSTYTVLFSVNSYPGTQVTGGPGTLINGVFTSDPIPCGTPYSFEIITNGACSQTVSGNAPCLLNPACPNFNLPAPLADSCHQAPLLCGNFLEGYCSTNAGLTEDQPPFVIGQVPSFEKNGWLRAVACEDSVAIDFQVFDCQNGNELGFFLFTGDCDTLTLRSFGSAKDNTALQLTAGGITPGEPFFIMIDGYYGAECTFKTHVVSGIGTADPGVSTCTCTDGYIDGPGDLCPADIAVYTLVLPNCVIQPGQPVGGNGAYCPPPAEACPSPAQTDSTVLHWVIPPHMTFLSDSVNVNTITVEVDPNLIGVDTVLTGAVSVYWEHIDVPNPDTTAADPNSYCTCTSVTCDGNVKPKDVTIHHVVDYQYGVLTCSQPCYFYNGQPFCSPGIFPASQTNCLTEYLVLVSNQAVPLANAGPDKMICAGESAVVGATANGNPLYAYSWSSGGNTPQISVSPASTSTYTLVVTNTNNGCTSTDDVVVNVLPAIPPVTLPPLTVCNGDCATLGWGDVVCPASGQTYTAVLSSYQGCDSTLIQSVIVSMPQNVQLGVVGTITCAQPCVTFNGQEYCQPGIYSDTANCAVNQFEIAYDPSLPTAQLGVVDSLTCAHPCVTYNGEEFCQPGTYTTVAGCEIREFEIIMLPPVSLELGDDQTIVAGETITLQAQTDAQPATVTWFDQHMVLPGNGLSIQVRPTENTLYSVEIQDVNGCLLDDSLWVFVKEKTNGWYAPNAFKPGDGGPNSGFTLFVDGDRIAGILRLEIYNRWGEQVFSRQDVTPNIPDLGWDGEMNGKMLDPGVFVWQAELLLSDGTTTWVSGEVTLLR